MVFKNYDPNIPLDASLGLIFRLNNLWARVDEPAITGNFRKWNFLLDRLFVNLLYKESLDVEHDDKGKITDVKFNEKDKELFDFLNNKVISSQIKLKCSKTIKERDNAFKELYNALLLKDSGIRKFMYELKLYMKESNKNPANAMWGG